MKILHILVALFSILYMDINLMAITHLPPAVPYDPEVKLVQKSNEEWAKLLSKEQYNILREKGTERAFTGQYDKFYEKGTYICAACGNPLFSYETKFDSKTGWPSYYKPISPDNIKTEKDYSLFFIPRTEVLCARCGGHLGHVFKDGPEPTGLRYCINSIAISFKPKNQLNN